MSSGEAEVSEWIIGVSEGLGIRHADQGICMDLSLRCHCDSAAAPGDLNMIGVEKQASGSNMVGSRIWYERSGGSTKRRYERADTCCGRCSASEADGTAEHDSGHWRKTLWFLSLSLSEHFFFFSGAACWMQLHESGRPRACGEVLESLLHNGTHLESASSPLSFLVRSAVPYESNGHEVLHQ